MRIERPWAADGCYWEILVPGEADWAALAERIRAAGPDPAAAQRYLQARYGGEAREPDL